MEADSSRTIYIVTKRLSSAALALFGEKIVQLLAIAAANIVILRSLGPVEAGYLSAATALFAMALPLTSFGSVVTVGAISRTSSRVLERQLVAQAVTYAAGASAIGAAFLLVANARSTDPLHSLVIILSVALLSRPLWAVDVWFQSRHENSTAAVIRTLGIVVSAAGRITIALTSGRLDLLAWALLAEHTIIGFALSAVYIRRRGSFRFGRLPKQRRQSLWRTSWPLFLSGLAVILYMRIDQPMILWLSTSSQVSYYAAAANLNDALSFVPTVVFTLVYPILVRLFESDRAKFLRLNQRILECGAAASYCVSLVGIIVAPTLVAILFGTEFAAAGTLLQVLLLGLPFVFLGVLQTPWMLLHGLQKYSMLNAYAALTLNVLLNIYLIPIYGAVGAAVTTVIAHAMGGPLGNVFYEKTRPLFRQQLRALNPICSFIVAYHVIKDTVAFRRGRSV